MLDYRIRTDFNNQDEEAMFNEQAEAVAEAMMRTHHGQVLAQLMAAEITDRIYGR
jgi:hypothetical protein